MKPKNAMIRMITAGLALLLFFSLGNSDAYASSSSNSNYDGTFFSYSPRALYYKEHAIQPLQRVRMITRNESQLRDNIRKNKIRKNRNTKQSCSRITRSEKRQINTWIVEENLNKYGDPRDTMYAGGTPLFNELTGERINRYTYICTNHPDRPWR